MKSESIDYSARARFFSKVDRNGPVPPHCPELGPCHVWIGCCGCNGYGQFRLQGKTHRANRVAFYLAHGRWPEPCCLHHCDNRACVNDAHLFEGTPAENSADMCSKLRQALGGERHGIAKLTERDVIEIRSTYARGHVTQRHLATMFGVSQCTIYAVLKRKIWLHVEAGVTR